jgi:hypothetical protein
MHRRLFLGLAILMTTISIGCGGGRGGGRGSGNSTNRGVTAGKLAVSPSTLDFGKVAVGSQRDHTGTLTAGDSSITVASADWSGDGYSVSRIVFPVTVPAGQSISFKVTFAPNRAGSSPGNIRFVSNASNTPQAAFSGKGTPSGKHSVTLSWPSVAASAVTGYNIYRGTASKGPFTKINVSPHPSSTFTDASVVGGQTYFYMTTAVSKGGKESRYSNQVQVAIPNS